MGWGQLLKLFEIFQQSSLRRPEAVGVRLTQYASICHAGCICACHPQTKSSTPGFMDRVLGQLFVGYAGMPLLSQK